MALTVTDFAARIKAKYPDYANIPDDELAQRVIAKHPEYASQVDMSSQSGGGIMDAINSGAHSINDAIVNTAVGAVKGAGSTAYNLGKLAHNIPGMNAIAPDTAGAFSGPNEITNALKANGTAQSIGKGAEQVGEFFVPGASEAGMLAPVAGAIGRAGLVGKMALEGANAAGVATAQGGNPVAAGIGGAVAPAAVAGIGKLAPKILNSLIDARRAAFVTGANPGRGMADAGIVAPTLNNALTKTQAVQDALGQRIGQTLNTPAANTVKIDVTNAINKPIDDAIEGLDTIGAHDSIGRMEKMRDGVNAAFQKIGASPQGATPAQVFAVKKLLDKGIKHGTNEGIEVSAPSVAKAVRRNLASAINDAYPDVAPLNKKYADLAEATDAIVEKMNGGNKMMDLLQTLKSAGVTGLMGGGAYAYTHDPMTALAVMAAKKAAGSTLGSTTLAQLARAAGSETSQAVTPKVIGAGISGATENDQ